MQSHAFSFSFPSFPSFFPSSPHDCGACLSSYDAFSPNQNLMRLMENLTGSANACVCVYLCLCDVHAFPESVLNGRGRGSENETVYVWGCEIGILGTRVSDGVIVNDEVRLSPYPKFRDVG